MSKVVTFELNAAIGLASRLVTCTRMPRAGDSVPVHFTDGGGFRNTYGGAITNFTQILPDNQIWQVTLVDTKTTGEIATTAVLNFHTGSLQFPGPTSQDGRIRIYAMEDISSESSASSSSSSVSSSSSSSSSVSSSSSSSVSSRSASSISTSSSSRSSQSTSSSSLSSSSRSSQSTSSSSLSSSSASSSSSSSQSA